MKKVIITLILIALIVTSIILIKNKEKDSKFTINISTEANSKTVNVGDEVILTIKTNETIIASNFEINYDNEAFEVVGSETNNFNVTEKNGKIACIYADITGEGTNEFKLKLTAVKETSGKASFKMEDAKFRAEGQDESYTGDKISGIDKAFKLKVNNK
ncbi:MAG: hypothetical protein IJE05_02495 [Clostridia bacterium]|nr:hypothetical protein [Clostridia bacterium]